MTDWGSLRDAYGPAGQVPELLAAAAGAAAGAPVWDELWGRLCHQGTVTDASYAAIPVLTVLAGPGGSGAFDPALHLVAGIVGSTDGPTSISDVRERYAAEIDGLRDVAERNLAVAGDDVDFVHSLQALMVFEDGGVWQRELHAVADGEAELSCPTCSEDLILGLDGRRGTVVAFDRDVEPASVVPAPAATGAVEARLLDLARQHDRPAVAERVSLLLGEATCPACGTTFPVAHAFA